MSGSIPQCLKSAGSFIEGHVTVGKSHLLFIFFLDISLEELDVFAVLLLAILIFTKALKQQPFRSCQPPAAGENLYR